MEVAPDETVVLTVRVRGATASVVQRPGPPLAANLEIEETTPRIQRSYGTGRPDGVTFTWHFDPRQSGAAQIDPVTVVVRGRTYRTEPIRIHVVEPPQYPTSPTLTQPDASQATGGSSAGLDSRDLFIRATPSANQAYQNEQLVVEYRLFYRPGVRLRRSRLADAWDAPGFWREELDVASRPIPRSRRAYGRTYETIVLKRVALFPTRPGELHVDPLRIQAEAQATLRGPGGGSYRSRFEPIQLASRALSLSVRDLPPDAPPSFDGAVGQYGMSVRTNEDSTAVGRSVRLVVQVRGTGNLATLTAPHLEVPDAFESFAPDIQTNMDRSGRRIGGTKTFTYTLVPKAGGTHAVQPVTFAYFDPNAHRYETLRSDETRIHVTGTAGPEVAGRTGDGLPVGDITGLIRAEHVQWDAAQRRPLYRQLWVYVALLVPVLFAAGTVGYRRRRLSGRAAADGSQKTKEASAEAYLEGARELLQQGENGAAVIRAVERELLDFLDERLGANVTAARRPEVARELERRGVPDDVRDALFDLLDSCSEAQFARSSSSRGPRTVVQDGHTVVRRLDETLTERADTEWPA